MEECTVIWPRYKPSSHVLTDFLIPSLDTPTVWNEREAGTGFMAVGMLPSAGSSVPSAEIRRGPVLSYHMFYSFDGVPWA